jgi:hypothetical protein
MIAVSLRLLYLIFQLLVCPDDQAAGVVTSYLGERSPHHTTPAGGLLRLALPPPVASAKVVCDRPGDGRVEV